ncbi:hypothetical protein GCM10010447_20380 [Streptomyces fulvorobeus]
MGTVQVPGNRRLSSSCLTGTSLPGPPRNPARQSDTRPGAAGPARGHVGGMSGQVVKRRTRVGERLRTQDCFQDYFLPMGAHAFHLPKGPPMLAIAAAVLFFIAFLINAADVTTNEVFASVNVMLLGLALLALHVAGIGSGWRAGRR